MIRDGELNKNDTTHHVYFTKHPSQYMNVLKMTSLQVLQNKAAKIILDRPL